MTPLNILHVLRSPVGGLFRHVADLSLAQAERGHHVGIVADSTTGGARADDIFSRLEPHLSLGLIRFPIARGPGPTDTYGLVRVMRRVHEIKPDVVHGHGAKGGLFSRLIFNRPQAIRAYTPHGGSLLFGHDTLAGRVFLGTENLLMRRGDLFLFESAFSADTFRRKVGTPKGLVRVVHNGVSRAEFEPVTPAPDATDLLFLGEMRHLKGVDLILDAIAQLRQGGRPLTATLVGDGPDRAQFEAQAQRLDLTGVVRFPGPMPGRQALPLGRVMVMASRAESLPYVVLETAAAGMPLIATWVGGIPEIYGAMADRLAAPDDATALAAAIVRVLDHPEQTAADARALRERVSASFSVDSMVGGVLSAYRDALAARRQMAPVKTF